MRVLYLCAKNYWQHKMSRVRFHGIDAIGRHPEIELIKSGPGWPGFVSAPEEEKKHNPDVVVWYKPLNIPGYTEIKSPKCLRYNEMWQKDWTSSEITQSKSELVISHHQNDIKNFAHVKTVKFYHNPHCAEKTIFKPYNDPKVYDVLLIGVISPTFYPLRSVFKRVIEERLSEKVRCKILPHPGYNIPDVESQVRIYAQEISKAKMVLTCSSKYKYALAKYAEVPLCGTLLAADIPDEAQSWYRKWVVELNETMSDSEIEEKILYYLSHEEEYKKKTDTGFQGSLLRRTQEHYAERFVGILNNFFSERGS